MSQSPPTSSADSDICSLFSFSTPPDKGATCSLLSPPTSSDNPATYSPLCPPNSSDKSAISSPPASTSASWQLIENGLLTDALATKKVIAKRKCPAKARINGPYEENLELWAYLSELQDGITAARQGIRRLTTEGEIMKQSDLVKAHDDKLQKIMRKQEEQKQEMIAVMQHVVGMEDDNDPVRKEKQRLERENEIMRKILQIDCKQYASKGVQTNEDDNERVLLDMSAVNLDDNTIEDEADKEDIERTVDQAADEIIECQPICKTIN